jgi:hypothetical protein
VADGPDRAAIATILAAMTELTPEVQRRRTFAIISHPEQSL